jgi:hypothetical protein
VSVYRFINPAMNRLLRSPWHGLMSRRIMIVSYHGRKSGRPYQTPVSYDRDGDTVYCFTNGRWRFNFRSEAQAELRIRGQDYPARGAIYDGDQDQQVAIMSHYFKAVPQDKKFYGVRCDSEGEPIRSQVIQATQVIDIIRFQLL